MPSQRPQVIRTSTFRLRRVSTRRTSGFNDLEWQQSDESQARRYALLKVLFNIDKEAVSVWPGAHIYVRYLEQQIKKVGTHVFDPILSEVKITLPATVANVLDFAVKVAETIKSDHQGDFSVNAILDSALAKYGAKVGQVGKSRLAGQQSIFIIVGWLTMLFQPVTPSPADGNFRLLVLDKQSPLKSSLSIETSRRPIAGILRGLGSLLPGIDVQKAEQIHVSSLNIYALKTIGKVNIQWVDTLSAHLDFHPLSRTLLLFRFPTFCALNCLDNEDDNCFDRILRDYYQTQQSEKSSKTRLLLAAYKREVLLSYRVLFGQQRRSRNVWIAHERRRAGEDGLLDPLLAKLCGQSASALRHLPTSIWSTAQQDVNNNLLEQDVYSTQTDFPLLGSRLLSLQEFSLRQSPSKIRDLWRDHRDTMQWYTLWAVLLIGGLSLILTTLQLLVGIAQLVVSIKQTCPQVLQ